MLEKNSDGGVAISNRRQYYYASLLVAGVDHLRQSENQYEPSRHRTNLTLADWMFSDQKAKKQLRNTTPVTKLIGKTW